MSYSKSGEKVNIDCDNAIQIETGIETVRKDQSELKIQIVNVLLQRDSKWIIFLISCNSIVVYYLWNWSISTNSIALKAYVNTVAFNICALTVCLISVWVEQNSLRRSREFTSSSCGSRTPSPRRSFSLPICIAETKTASISALGPEKYEVLALLLSSCLILVLEFFVAVEAVARIGEQPVVHEGRLGLGAVLGLLAHLATILAHPDASLNHVVCKALPCPTLGGANPILAGNLVSVAILAAVHVAVHLWELYTFDTAAAFAVIGLIVASMLPLAFYTASVILQKVMALAQNYFQFFITLYYKR